MPARENLWEKLIAFQEEQDCNKFDTSDEAPLNEQLYALRVSLTRMAVYMQLSGTTVIRDGEFQSVLKDAGKYIKKSGLATYTNGGYSFVHNIIKEYYCAFYLSTLDTKEIIRLISTNNEKDVDLKWVNTVNLLFQINGCSLDLFNWLVGINPLYILKGEIEVPESDKRLILEQILKVVRQDNIWYSNPAFDVSELASACESQSVLDLLLEHIERALHFRELSFCLELLSNFSQTYFQHQRVIEVLKNSCCSSNTRPYEREKILACFAELRLNSDELTDWIIDSFIDSSRSEERMGVLSYLRISGILDSHWDVIVSELDAYYKTVGSFNNDLSELLSIKRSIEVISSSDAVAGILNWFAENNRWDFGTRSAADEMIGTLLAKAAVVFNSNVDALFVSVYRLLLHSLDMFNHSLTKELSSFMKKVDKYPIVLEKLIVDKQQDMHIGILEDLIGNDLEGIDVLCKLYSNGTFEQAWLFESFARTKFGDTNIYNKMDGCYYAKTSKHIEPPVTDEGLTDSELEDAQVFFDALFDGTVFASLVGSLIEICSDNDVTVKDVLDDKYDIVDYPCGTSALVDSLYGYQAYGSIRLPNFFEKVVWNEYVINSTLRVINGHERIKVSKGQYDELNNLVCTIVNNTDYSKVVKEKALNSYTCAITFRSCSKLIIKLNMEVPEKYYCGLIEIPAWWLDVQGVEEKYDYVESHISKKTIADYICKHIVDEKRYVVLSEYIYASDRYGIPGLYELIIKCSQDSNFDHNTRATAIKYALKYNAFETVLEQVLPVADEELLIILSECEDALNSNTLMDCIETKYLGSKSLYLLKALINLRAPKSLQYYLEAAREGCLSQKDAEMIREEMHVALERMDMLESLQGLCDLVRFCYSGDYTDSDFYPLSTSLRRALVSCSNNSYDQVESTVKDLKAEFSEANNLEGIAFCSLVVSNIHNNRMVPKEYSLKEKMEIISSIN